MVGHTAKIYPFQELRKLRGPLTDHVGDQELKILYDRKKQTLRMDNQPANVIAFVAFINDLKTFYPGAEIYHRPNR
jgi:hypothetical protein